MDIIEKIEKWSGKVKTKYEPPEGLFTKDAETIASQLAKDSTDLQQAMSRLNFYINRVGTNLSPDRKSTLENVKELLRKKFGVSESINEKKYTEEDVEIMIDELNSNLDDLSSAFVSIGNRNGIKQIKVIKKEVSKL